MLSYGNIANSRMKHKRRTPRFRSPRAEEERKGTMRPAAAIDICEHSAARVDHDTRYRAMANDGANFGIGTLPRNPR
jgi:hypothetical protein